jgi:hypothetical protein
MTIFTVVSMRENQKEKTKKKNKAPKRSKYQKDQPRLLLSSY